MILAAVASLPTSLRDWFGLRDAFQRILATADAEHWRRLPIGALICKVGLEFLGVPYVGSTLETSDDVEECTVRLDGLDCVTFYETAFAMARMIKLGGSTMEALVAQVELMRYRNGVRNGYLSRIHYTSEWLTDNESKGLVQNITPKLDGAVRLDKPFDFMSTHPNLYRQLRAHPEWLADFRAMEAKVASAKPWYVPKEVLRKSEPLLRSGDIVGIATSKRGLDTSHTGLCFRDGTGACRFLNASSSQKQVVLGPKLVDYLDSIKSDTGVMIARPLEPKRA